MKKKTIEKTKKKPTDLIYKKDAFDDYVLWKSMPSKLLGSTEERLKDAGFKDEYLMELMSLKNKTKNLIFFFLNIFFFWHPRKASILMYHSVDDNEVVFNVWPEDFEGQMRYLKKKNYKIIRLKELIKKIKNSERIDKKTVVLTLDDGFKDNYTNAFPLLEKYNFPATIFLPTAYIGKEMNNSQNIPLNIMTWNEAREMENSGLVDFAFHTHTHPEMKNINLENFAEELRESEKLLAENLKNPLKIFSYPKGRFKPEQVEYIKKTGYEAAVGTGEGLVGAGDDLFFLKRNFIYSKGGLSQFKGKLGPVVEIYNFLKIWKK